jgi:hypothetical protein
MTMSTFNDFKKRMTAAFARLRPTTDPEYALLKAIQGSGDWGVLEERLLEARALARRRQQEALGRIEPLASHVASLVDRAKTERIRVKKQHLLRQADDYMRDLESEEEPARIYSANARMLTNLIAQVRRARAMEERGVEAGALDAFTDRMEAIVVGYEGVLDAAGEVGDAGTLEADAAPAATDIETRLAAVYVDDEPEPAATPAEERQQQSEIETRLFENA